MPPIGAEADTIEPTKTLILLPIALKSHKTYNKPMKMLQYFKTREFFLSLIVVVVGGIVGYFYFFNIFLDSYTNHGESVVVPDVVKMSYEEAKKKLEAEDLAVEVKDSVYIPNTTGSIVLRQIPGASSAVKPDRTIFLTISKSIPPLVKMPKVIDLSVYQAKSKLEAWKLQVKEVRKVPDIAKNMVLRVTLDGKEVKEGDELPQGTALTVIVGEGEAMKKGYVYVPSMIGLRYEDVAPRLSALGLNFAPEYDNTNGDQKAFEQSPMNDSVSRGTTVRVKFHSLIPLK